MKNLLIITLIFTSAFLFPSCKKDGAATLKDTKELHYKKYNGKYEVISCTSNKPVDINLDGTSSLDLQEELTDLKQAYLEIRIIKDEPHNLYHQFWPEQYVDNYISDAKPFINFAIQGLVFEFNINPDQDQLILDTTKISKEDSERFVVPSAVKITEDNLIEAIFNKKVYTSSGWKTIIITAFYKRWTSET